MPNRHHGRHWLCRLVVAAVLAVTTATTSLAHADAYEAAIARGIAAKEKALESNAPADWQEAEKRFEEADAIRSTPETKYEIGVAASHLKEEDVAVESFEVALATGLGGAAREKALAYVAAGKPKLARLRVTGTAGTQIWIAGRKRGVLPLARSIVVFPGSTVVRVVEPLGTVEKMVTAKEGEEVTLDLAPQKPVSLPATTASPQPPPTSPGRDAKSSSLDWTLVIGGGALAVMGGVGFIVANKTIAEHRDSLGTNCVSSAFDGETCRLALPTRGADAQADADAIVTWQGLRVAAIAAFGVGVLSVTLGTFRVLGRDRPASKSSAWTLAIDPGSDGPFLRLRGAF